MKKLYDGFVLIMVALVTTAVRDVVIFGGVGATGNGSVGIAQTAGAVGENISVDTVGVYEFPAKTADTFAVGAVVYYDGSEITTTATANTRAGIAWSAKASAVEGTVEVKIG